MRGRGAARNILKLNSSLSSLSFPSRLYWMSCRQKWHTREHLCWHRKSCRPAGKQRYRINKTRRLFYRLIFAQRDLLWLRALSSVLVLCCIQGIKRLFQVETRWKCFWCWRLNLKALASASRAWRWRARLKLTKQERDSLLAAALLHFVSPFLVGFSTVSSISSTNCLNPDVITTLKQAKGIILQTIRISFTAWGNDLRSHGSRKKKCYVSKEYKIQDG